MKRLKIFEFYYDMPISKKLGMGFIILSIFFAIAFFVPMTTSYNITNSIGNLEGSVNPVVRASSMIKVNSLWMLFELRSYLNQSSCQLNQDGSNIDTSSLQRSFNHVGWIMDDANAVKSVIPDTTTDKQLSLILQAADSLILVGQDYKKWCHTAEENMHKVFASNVYIKQMVGEQSKRIDNEINHQLSLAKNDKTGMAAQNILLLDEVKLCSQQIAIAPDEPTFVQQNFNQIEKAFSQLVKSSLVSKSFIEKESQFFAYSNQYFLEYQQMVGTYHDSRGENYRLGFRIVEIAANMDGLSANLIGKVTSGISLKSGFVPKVLFVSFFLIIAFCIFFYWQNRKQTVKPLHHLTNTIDSVTEGDLNTKCEILYMDEIGTVGDALNKMTERLSDIFLDIKRSSKEIYNFSAQMNKVSSFINQGANTQASNTEEVSTSIQQMSAGIQQSSQNAVQTEQLTNRTLEKVKLSSDASHNSMVAMKDIATKIGIIDEIAFQTNILALNAAVEAARAGEQGKGFAVVASEVRKLAERSAQAAQQIDKVSKESVEIAENAQKMLLEIIPDIEKTAQLVREIAAAGQEQSSGIEHISIAVEQLNEVTQSYAAQAEELASTSHELETQSQVLAKSVDYFKI